MVAILIIIVILVCIVLFFVLAHDYYSDLEFINFKVKMTFEEFITLYKEKPSSFILDGDFPRHNNHNIVFGFIDYLKYKKWLEIIRKDFLIKELNDEN